MKLSRLHFSMPAGLAIGLAVVSSAFGGGPTKKPTPAATNSVPVVVEVPRAVFDVTSSPVKDPFFPLSTRTPNPVATTNAAPTYSASSFLLKGLSGPPNNRLALINNRTVAAGESAEVTTSAGRIKIKCVEIRDDTVFIQAENLPDVIELHFEERPRK